MGKGRHSPYEKRSKKKQRIYKIKLIITENGKGKAWIWVGLALYLISDFLQDGTIGDSLLGVVTQCL